jgi:hypothetical protein
MVLTSKNPLLDEDVIKKRLKALENGFASNDIEGLTLPQEEKDFLIDLVKKGLNGDEMIKAMDKGLKFEK